MIIQQRNNSTEKTLESDTEEEILAERCEEIEKQNLSVYFINLYVHCLSSAVGRTTY